MTKTLFALAALGALLAIPAAHAADWCALDFGKVQSFGHDDKIDGDAIATAVQQVLATCHPGSKLTVQFPSQISEFVVTQVPSLKIALCDIRYPILPLGGTHLMQDFVCTAGERPDSRIDFPQ